MEVPIINRISDFDAGINSLDDPSVSSRAFAVSGVGKLHHAYSFWKWSILLLITFFASFTTLITRIKSLVIRLSYIDVSLPPPTVLYDYDSDSDSSCSLDSSDEEEDDDDDEEDDSVSRWRRVNGDSRVRGSGYYLDDDKGINGNIPWMRRSSGSFGDLLSWPDLGGFGSSGVVKLWDHLDINVEGGFSNNAVASFFRKCGASSLSPAVLFAAKKKGSDAVEVSAWDSRAGIRMPALLAEWRQPGRSFGKIVKIDAGNVNKIYVGNDVDGEIIVGDMRMVNGALTETEVDKTMRRRRRH